MHDKKISDPFTSLYVIATLIIIIAGMRASAIMLVPMLLAVFIAIICSYPLNKLRMRGVSKGLSIIIVISFTFTIALLLALVLGASFSNFSNDLPVFQEKLELLLDGLNAGVKRFGIELDTINWHDYFDPGIALGFATTVLKGLRLALTNSFLIGLTVIFILIEIPLIRKGTQQPAPPSNYQLIIQEIQQYFGLKTMTSLATGIIISIWLVILGVDYPLLWGTIAFLLNFVPSIGSIIAAIPAVILALILDGTTIAILTATGYAVVNMIIGNVIEPRIMGHGLGLSMLVVFLSLVIWGWVLGPVGMLLAVPLTMTLKVILKNHEQTRAFALLLEGAQNHNSATTQASEQS